MSATEAALIGGRLGFGCARLFGGPEEKQSGRLLEAALKAGILHFDTAPSYGNGLSEQVVGRVLAGVRGVTIATKVGIPRPEGHVASISSRVYRRYFRPVLGRYPAAKRPLLALSSAWRHRRSVGTERRDAHLLDARTMESELEVSLRLLQRDTIDILLIHEPEHLVLDEGLVPALLRLVEMGTIRAIGLAYGGVAGPVPSFASVLQSAFQEWETDAASPRTVRIFHGAMRAPSSSPSHLRGVEALVDCMKRRPDSILLFSASTPKRIAQVAEAVTAGTQPCAP